MGEYFCDICKFYDDDVSSKFVICCHTCIVPTNQCIFLHLLCGTDREIGVPLQRLWHMQVSKHKKEEAFDQSYN